MAKTKISEFSATPGNNTDIDGINIAEGCAPSGINDAIRELMSQLKDWQAGTSNDPMVIGSSGSLTLSYGTANGVVYLNGSKVLTTGSALTFDGTTLGVGVLTVNSNNISAVNSLGFRNRIINGAMVIDQRNAGASVTPTNGQYSVDRWRCLLTQASKYTFQQNAGAITPPTGFTKYLGITSSSAYSIVAGDIFNLYQCIEGFNIADLNWGTANAQPVTLSFWVRSSLTGAFGGSLQNGASNRSYPFTYTISAANTWTFVSINIAGDTSGTWATDNTAGIFVYLGLGVGSTYSGTAGSWASANYQSSTGATSVVGTNGATFYITGVQLEAGSVATPFERRPYGTELALCQRYYQLTYEAGSTPGSYGGNGSGYLHGRYVTSYAYTEWYFKVDMRTTPTITTYAPFDGTSGKCWIDSTGSANTALGGGTGNKSILITCGTSNTNPFYFHAVASAEL